jgi:hypothetical protein
MRADATNLRPPRPSLGAVIAICLLLSGCSGGSTLSEQERSTVTSAIERVSSEIGVVFSAEDEECVVEGLDAEVAVALAGASIGEADGGAFGERVVECVGANELAGALLLPLAGGIRTSSLECAAEELDRAFVVSMVAAAVGAEPLEPSTIELRSQFALSVCLGPDELGERSGQ